MEQLIKHIYRRLAKEEWRFLPSGLKSGKIGLAVFLALYSDFFSNNSSRKLSAKILYDLLQDISLLPYGLVSGKMGIAWSLYLLYQRDILERDEPLDDLLNPYGVSIYTASTHSAFSSLQGMTCFPEESICCDSATPIVH